MTRPTQFGQGRAQGVISTGGDPSLPPGQPPVDCCDDDTEIPDRAIDQTVFVGLKGGTGALVQWDADVFNGALADLDYPSDTVAGNLLVAILIDRGGGTTPAAPTGWTFVNNGGETDPDEGTMFWRIAPGGATSFTMTSGPTNEQRLYIMEFDGGAAGLLDTTRVQAGASTSTFTVPAVTVASDAILVGDVLGSTFPADLTYTEDPDFTNIDQGKCGGGLEPDSNVGYRVVTAGTYDYAPTGSGSTAYGGVLAAFSLLAGDTWTGGGPNITDGDDATYQEITGENVVRIWLGDAFSIARVRLLIGTETAGAKSYTLKGANASDFSDAVTVATLDWTATGSFTADEVIETWTPLDAYEFWELTGDDETRYVYSFELYEASIAVDVTAVQADIDNHIADTTDAHDASAVSVADADGWTATTDVEAYLAELGGKVQGYLPLGNLGAAETFDSAIGWYSGTLNANCTFTLVAGASGMACQMLIELAQDGTGGWTIDLPASVTNGAALEADQDTTLSTTSFLILMTRDGGTTWYGFWAGGSGAGVTYGTPAIVLGTAAAAGSIDEAIRRDSTIIAFDATAPTTQAFGDAAATGAAAIAARRDHKHAMPANPVTEAAVQAVGHYEVMMDGGSPPAALESGSGTDWLYVWVTP